MCQFWFLSSRLWSSETGLLCLPLKFLTLLLCALTEHISFLCRKTGRKRHVKLSAFQERCDWTSWSSGSSALAEDCVCCWFLCLNEKHCKVLCKRVKSARKLWKKKLKQVFYLTYSSSIINLLPLISRAWYLFVTFTVVFFFFAMWPVCMMSNSTSRDSVYMIWKQNG